MLPFRCSCLHMPKKQHKPYHCPPGLYTYEEPKHQVYRPDSESSSADSPFSTHANISGLWSLSWKAGWSYVSFLADNAFMAVVLVCLWYMHRKA